MCSCERVRETDSEGEGERQRAGRVRLRRPDDVRRPRPERECGAENVRNVHVGWFLQARRDGLQSSAKRNMAPCSSQELRGRGRREGATEGVRVRVGLAGGGEDKGFPRAASPSPLPKDVNGTI